MVRSSAAVRAGRLSRACATAWLPQTTTMAPDASAVLESVRASREPQTEQERMAVDEGWANMGPTMARFSRLANFGSFGRAGAARVVGLALAAWLLAGCALSRYQVTHVPAEPYDAVIVPGCPSEEDGALSYCQIGRAGQAALLWQGAWTRNFIVSGSDVHTPYVEAEAIAQAMTTLGVPPERIVLERDALHSDENVYYSALLATRLGFQRLAIASNGAIASWLCGLLVEEGRSCAALPMDLGALNAYLPAHDAALRALRAHRVDPWEPLPARADRIARASGHGRPPSFVFYPLHGWLGSSHVPIAPAHPMPITWAERLHQYDTLPP